MGFIMALFCPCPFYSPQPLKLSAVPKSSIPKTLLHKPVVPKISSVLVSLSPNKPFPSLQRVLCGSSSPAESDKSPSTGIFIKGLPQSTTEGLLKKTFSQFGEVSQVQIITDRKSKQPLGSAFVWFTVEEAVQSAVDGMNGKFFNGRFVLVTKAKPGLSKHRGKTIPYQF